MTPRDIKSLNKFVRRSIFALFPLAVLGVVYVALDPFKVVRHHSPYYEKWSPLPFNKSYASTVIYLDGRSKYHYDSFLFGGSRTIYFEAGSWKKHIGDSASVFHFDGPLESPISIAAKLKLIESNGDTVKNAIIESPPWAFNGEYVGFPFRMPWQLIGFWDYPRFQYLYFKDFLNREMFFPLMRYYFTGEARETSDMMVFATPMSSFDIRTNETIDDSVENIITIDPRRYYQSHSNDFIGVRDSFAYEYQQIREDEVEALRYIADVFRRHGTDYVFIIGPDLNHSLLSPENRKLLDSIFGSSNIYDFTRWDVAFSDSVAFYDPVHFRPYIASMIMDSIYSRRQSQDTLKIP